MKVKCEIMNGDALQKLKELKTNSVDICVTSPPYWGLRDYGVNGQIGQESDFRDYLKNLIIIFDETKRVLKSEGSLYVNLGDTYAGTGNKKNHKDPKNKKGRTGQEIAKNNKVKGVQRKSLIGIPERFMIAMIDSGWICRNTIIWEKPNAMPSPVKDRYTSSFEKIFFFTKQQKYFFKQQLEQYTAPLNRWGGNDMDGVESKWDDGVGQSLGRKRNLRPNPKGRNKRDVWKINTKGYKDAHFAVYPLELINPIIQASCPPNGVVLDPFAGSGTTGVAALQQNKNAILIELNSEYVELIKKRTKNTLKPLF